MQKSSHDSWWKTRRWCYPYEVSEYFIPKRNKIYERYVFNSCSQKADESFDQFLPFSPVKRSQMRNKPVLPRLQTPQLTTMLAKMIVPAPHRCLNRALVCPVLLILCTAHKQSCNPYPVRTCCQTKHTPERLCSRRDFIIRHSCFSFKNRVPDFSNLVNYEDRNIGLILSWFISSFAFYSYRSFTLEGRCYVMHMSHDLHPGHQ